MGDSRRCRHWRTRRFGPFDDGVREDKDTKCEEIDEKEGMLYDFFKKTSKRRQKMLGKAGQGILCVMLNKNKQGSLPNYYLLLLGNRYIFGGWI